MYFVAGQAVTVTLEFKVDGEFVIPTANSVRYTLRGPDGLAYTGHDDQALTVPGTSYKLTLPDTVNTKTRLIENRFLDVVFDYNGRTYETSAHYRLTDRLLHMVTKDQVRAKIGVNDREVPDTSIDLVKAYYVASDAIGATDFVDALQDDPINANDAIACAAAIATIPSLQLSIAAEEGTDSSSYKRIASVDFEKLALSLAQQFAQATQAITGLTVSAPPLAVFSAPTDPLTGA